MMGSYISLCCEGVKACIPAFPTLDVYNKITSPKQEDVN